MDDFDQADLDGDGEFDGIDIALLSECEKKASREYSNQQTGCCFPFLIATISFFAGGGVIVSDFIL